MDLFDMSAEDYAEVKRDFDEMDRDGSGSITLAEVRHNYFIVHDHTAP